MLNFIRTKSFQFVLLICCGITISAFSCWTKIIHFCEKSPEAFAIMMNRDYGTLVAMGINNNTLLYIPSSPPEPVEETSSYRKNTR